MKNLKKILRNFETQAEDLFEIIKCCDSYI